MNIGAVLWIILTIPASIWVGSGNPEMGFIACVFWGMCIGGMATAGLVAAFGQIWIGWHTPEIIDEVVEGLLGKGRK
jgi:hypothetical protein